MEDSMKTLISNAIANITSVVQSFGVKHLLAVTLAVFLAITSTACSATSAKTEPRSEAANPVSLTTNNSYDKNTGSKRELYKPTQKPQGGINNYNDDPKYDGAAAKADSKKLVKKVEENLQNRAKNPKDVVENIRDRNVLGEKANDISRNITNSADNLKDDFAEGTERGVRNLKINADRASENVPRVVDEAKDNAKAATRDAKEGAKDLPDSLQKVGSRALDAAKDKAQDTAEAIRDRA
jgi:hypothetical protein